VVKSPFPNGERQRKSEAEEAALRTKPGREDEKNREECVPFPKQGGEEGRAEGKEGAIVGLRESDERKVRAQRQKNGKGRYGLVVFAEYLFCGENPAKKKDKVKGGIENEAGRQQ
jgi:hypothetical protein